MGSEDSINIKPGRSRIIIPVSVVLLLVIVLFGYWIFRRSDRQMRQLLMQQANAVAMSVNVKFIKALSGDKSDLDKFEYLQLKEQFAAVRNSDGRYKFVYLMGRKDKNTIFFYADADEEDPAMPGEVYDDASDELIEIFDTKKAFVEGPLPDEWGVWVSAIVPVIDPQSGEVLAVLGMDSDATVWNWNILIASLIPLGLMLLLIIGIATAIFSIHYEAKSSKLILMHLMLPLTVVLLLLLTGSILLLVMEQRSDLKNSSQHVENKICAEFNQLIKQHAYNLSSMADVLSADSEVAEVFNQRSPKISQNAKEGFSRLLQKHYISYYAFVNSRGAFIFHSYFNDEISDVDYKGFTLLEAMRTGRAAHGLEIKRDGELLVQAVKPVRIKEEVAGYLIMGISASEVIEKIHFETGTEIAVIINKKFIQQQLWYDYEKSRNKFDSWKRLEDYVLNYTTKDKLSQGEVEFINTRDIAKCEEPSEINFDSESWHVMTCPVIDAGGDDIGNILVFRNISAVKAAQLQLLLLYIVIGILILFSLLSFLFVLLRRTDLNIRHHLKKIREGEQKHKILFDNSQDAYLLLNTHLEIIDCNKASAYLFNCDIAKLRGTLIIALLPEVQTDNQPSEIFARQHINIAFEHGHDRFTCIHQRPDRSTFWCEVVLSSMRMGGEPVMFASLRDITAIKKAEDDLTESVSLLNATLESTADGIVVINLQDEIVCWNKKFQDLWAAGDSILKNKNGLFVFEYIYDKLKNADSFRQSVDSLHKSHEGTSFNEIILEDGRVIECYSQPQRLGKFIAGRVWSFRDVTDKNHALKELLQSERMAAIGTLAAGIAHNFNNLNAGIIGHLEIMKHKEPLSTEGEKKLNLVLNTVRRSIALTDSLLTLTGKRKGKQMDYHLAPLINDTILLLQNKFTAEGVIIKSRVDINATAYCSPGEICHVIFNLLNNARHAMIDAATKVITIECERQDTMSVIRISDTGCGISEDKVENIFTPFYTTKGERASKDSPLAKVRGTGLGLSSSSTIIKNHCGSIEVESTLGEGTTFIVKLPSTKAD